MPKVTRAAAKTGAKIAKSLTPKAKSKPYSNPKAKLSTKKPQDSAESTVTSKSVTPQGIISRLTKNYESERNEEAAKAMKAYMRGQYEYYGLKSPIRRELSRECLLSCSTLTQAQLHKLLKMLWEKKEREFQMFGLDVSDRCIKRLTGKSLDDTLRSIRVVRELIETKSWWDTVDMLASKTIGQLVATDRVTLTPVMDEWVKDDDLWVRRTAILHQLNYKDKTDKALLFRYCKLCAHEEDFFIRKAIGWALRQYARTDPSAVRTFVKENESELSNLSRKEAMKHL